MRRKHAIVLLVVASLVSSAAFMAYQHWKNRDPVLSKSGLVLAFQINNDAEAPNAVILHGRWQAVKQMAVPSAVSGEILAALHDDDNFKGGHRKCFEPGMAFRVGVGNDAVDAFVCLHCDNVYYYRVADEMAYKSSSLSPRGHEAFLSLYRTLFPEAATNPSSQPTSQNVIR